MGKGDEKTNKIFKMKTTLNIAYVILVGSLLCFVSVRIFLKKSLEAI